MFSNTRLAIVSVAIVAALLAVTLLSASALAAVDREITAEEEAWLADVQAEVQRNDYGWTAGPTSVSHLSPQERDSSLAVSLEIPLCCRGYWWKRSGIVVSHSCMC